MIEKKILVLGGTGKTGRRVVDRLKQSRVSHVRIGSRTAQPSFDWEDATTWNEAVNGIDTVYITFQPDLAIPAAPSIIKNFTELASKNGVKKMVLLSGRGEQEAQLCEEIVKQNAINWTIVRASWFNQNFSESIFLDPILAGHVALPRAEALEPFTDADDIADVVVKCLLNDEHNKQTYELTGPRLMTFKEVISEIAKATERDITFQALSLDEYTQMLRQYHVPEDHIWLANYLFTEVLDGRNASVKNDIEKVLGRKAKDFSEYVKANVEVGVWNAATLKTVE
ncbi:NmrA family transcriptional regulator [Chryseotalea sanaruensis]|uniref:NmrA family transcriptional regulator n=1 Tax=Chryseotalea sanaruensis TaxID=2482724 RepID=A0A401U8U5_9BACT|nr:NAD(P)H-binding protein [Chryseotalea sanaruensis]GCC51294.1 NmrA family transcriptional regulator [Chryseotalea sanaruensis]